MKQLLGLIFLILLFAAQSASALYGNYDEFAQDAAEQEASVPKIIPKGSVFRGFMGQTVSSEFNNNGDRVKILIPSDFTYENEVLIPKNTLFIGEVLNIEKAQQGRNGLFSVDIVGIVFPDGRSFPIKGYVSSAKNNKVFGGEFSRRSGHKNTLHRSACFGRKGTLQLLQNGPRVMGKETLINMGDFVTIIIDEAINIEQ